MARPASHFVVQTSFARYQVLALPLDEDSSEWGRFSKSVEIQFTYNG